VDTVGRAAGRPPRVDRVERTPDGFRVLVAADSGASSASGVVYVTKAGAVTSVMLPTDGR
jgi:hypothetical protein